MHIVVSAVVLVAALGLGLVPDPGAHFVHGILAFLALVPPLGACAVALVGAPRVAARVGFAALGLWGLALAATAGASVAGASWTFYSPYHDAGPSLVQVLAFVGPLLALAAGIVGALAGALATWRSAPWTAAGLVASALVHAWVGAGFAALGMDAPIAIDALALLPALGLALPALGVLATAAHRARWRGAPLAWALVALSMLGVALVTEVAVGGHDLHFEDTLVVVASRHYLLLTAVAGLLGGLAAARPEALGRAGSWMAVAFAVGAHSLGAAGLTLGVQGIPRRYVTYMEGVDVGPIVTTAGGVIVLAVVVWVLVLVRWRPASPPAPTPGGG